jgi:hypothetical protein
MATLGTIRTRVRTTGLLETTASFWSDAELLEHIVEGIKDLWGAIIDLHQEHFATDDATNVSLAANSSSLAGVPADMFRVLLIEPRDMTNANSARAIRFIPRDYNSPEFEEARSMTAQDPYAGTVIYYAVFGAGAPTGTATIKVAPQINAALTLRLVYVPTLAATDMEAGDANPIPGEADNALFAWCMAFARAKERDDRSPDPNWLAVYATEKQNILTRLTPRQEHEPEYVSGMFEGML